jgi:hypothetical protein
LRCRWIFDTQIGFKFYLKRFPRNLKMRRFSKIRHAVVVDKTSELPWQRACLTVTPSLTVTNLIFNFCSFELILTFVGFGTFGFQTTLEREFSFK